MLKGCFLKIFLLLSAMKNNKLYLNLGIGVLVLILVLFLAIKVVPSVLVTLTKAAPSSKVDLASSYILGGKILARADGEDKGVVNVFVLDKDGKGIKGVTVALSGTPEGEMQTVSGNEGKAAFEVTSKTEGQFGVSAIISGMPIAGEVRLTFRNE